MSVCRSCGAPIVWVKTERGKRMPIDLLPYTGHDPRGLFVIVRDVAIACPPDAYPGAELFRSHFSTCPQADGWRHPPEHGNIPDDH